MREQPLSLLKRLAHWWLSFNMCKCHYSRFEVINGILACEDCRKPKKWDNRTTTTPSEQGVL